MIWKFVEGRGGTFGNSINTSKFSCFSHFILMAPKKKEYSNDPRSLFVKHY